MNCPDKSETTRREKLGLNNGLQSAPNVSIKPFAAPDSGIAGVNWKVNAPIVRPGGALRWGCIAR
jgi:hypothetical protein